MPLTLVETLPEVVVSVEALTVLGMFPILLPAPGVVPVEGLAGPVPVLGTPLSWDPPSPLAALPSAGTPGPAPELEDPARGGNIGP